MSKINSNRPPRPATAALRQAWDEYKAAVEYELSQQETKSNKASEVRMRKLLLSFRPTIYEPYRDATLNRE